MSIRDNLDISAYLVLGPENTLGRPVGDVVAQALDAGFTCIQVRSKVASAREIIALTGDAAQAIAQAGKTGQVKIYDIGGTQEDKPAIETGELEMTVPFFPYTQAYCAVEMLAAVNAGMPVPRVVVNDCHKTDGSPDTQNPVVITRENVAKFVPQG